MLGGAEGFSLARLLLLAVLAVLPRDEHPVAHHEHIGGVAARSSPDVLSVGLVPSRTPCAFHAKEGHGHGLG